MPAIGPRPRPRDTPNPRVQDVVRCGCLDAQTNLVMIGEVPAIRKKTQRFLIVGVRIQRLAPYYVRMQGVVRCGCLDAQTNLVVIGEVPAIRKTRIS